MEAQDYLIKSEICRKELAELFSKEEDFNRRQSMTLILGSLVLEGYNFTDILDIFKFMKYQKEKKGDETEA